VHNALAGTLLNRPYRGGAIQNGSKKGTRTITSLEDHKTNKIIRKKGEYSRIHCWEEEHSGGKNSVIDGGDALQLH